MNVLRFDNPKKFAAVATPLLMRNEAENCFWLGMLSASEELAKAMMCTVRDDRGGCVAVATMSPQRQMVVTRAPADAVIALARHLHDQHIPLPGIGGVRESAETFAREWVRLTNSPTRVHVETIVHQLTRVIPPRPTSGRMRVAERRDIDLVDQWITDFRIEIGEGRLGSGREIAERRVPTGNIFLWEDGGNIVAMAGCSGPTPNGIRVNLVYTLPPFRGRGYASNLVAQLSQHLLDTGRKFCFLYTDLANPTSNKIYRAVGYEPLSESVHIMFDGAGGSH
jgi:predicted GNAT family acetyltransferase